MESQLSISFTKRQPSERGVALLASISASLLFSLKTWRRDVVQKDFIKVLILEMILARLMSTREEFATKTLMMA